jgi:hypothetical protein
MSAGAEGVRADAVLPLAQEQEQEQDSVLGGVAQGRVPLRELMDDRLLDELLERSKDAAGGCG